MGPSACHIAAMAHIRLDNSDATRAQRAWHACRILDSAIFEFSLEGTIATCCRSGIGGNEKALISPLDPLGESVQFAIETVEKNDTFDTMVDIAFREGGGRWQITAAITDDDNRHLGEQFLRLRVAIQLRKLYRGFVEETANRARLPEFPGA